MKVLCIGHATYDVVIPVDNYPMENTKNSIGGSRACGGGPASNVAYLLGKWGIDTYFAGLVGNDYEARIIKKEFNDKGVNTDYFIMDKDYQTTKSYVIVNKENASRTTFACQTEKKYLTDLNIDINPDIILIDGHEYELSRKIIENNKGAKVVIDAGRCTDEVIALCKLCDYVVCSYTFAKDYSKSDDLDIIFDKLRQDFNGEIVVTLEAKGCAYYNDGVKIIKGLTLKAIDTTAAGDIFHGAFTYGLAQGWDLYKILTFSNTTSGLSVTKITGRKSVFPLEIVNRVYDELRRRNFY